MSIKKIAKKLSGIGKAHKLLNKASFGGMLGIKRVKRISRQRSIDDLLKKIFGPNSSVE